MHIQKLKLQGTFNSFVDTQWFTIITSQLTKCSQQFFITTTNMIYFKKTDLSMI